MRYLKYILNGEPMRPQTFISNKRGWKQVTTLAIIPSSIVGLAFLAGMIPVAGLIDVGRFTKLRYHQYRARQHKTRYITRVLKSLNHIPTKTNIQSLRSVN